MQIPIAEGTTYDPIRPIQPRDELLNPNDCVHPWARLAAVQNNHVSHFLQCFECGVFMMINGYKFTFDFSKD